jgi:Wax ester synthase/diacylglycerol acyltransferase catalytic domain
VHNCPWSPQVRTFVPPAPVRGEVLQGASRRRLRRRVLRETSCRRFSHGEHQLRSSRVRLYDLRLFCSRPTALWDGYVESTTRGIRRAETPNEERPVIERASPADLAFLAMDTGKVPEQFAVILILERPGDLGLVDLRQLIEGRTLALPRLRQRLIKVPPGCGRSVWVDDHDFTIDRHVRTVSCRPPGDEAALLDTALSVIMTPLPRDHPLWSIVLITELADGCNRHHRRAAPRPRRRSGRIECPRSTCRSRSTACRRALPSAFAVTGQSCPGCMDDAASGDPSDGWVLAIAAARHVRGWRPPLAARNTLLARTTDRPPAAHGSSEAGSCSNRSRGTSWPCCCGCSVPADSAEQRCVRRSDCRHCAGLRPRSGPRPGSGQSRQPDAYQCPNRRRCSRTPRGG